MSGATGYHSLCAAASINGHPWLRTTEPRSKSIISKLVTTSTNRRCLSHQLKPTFHTHFSPLSLIASRGIRLVSSTVSLAGRNVNPKESEKKEEEEEVEVEEDLPWIQEKALDIVEFSGSVTQALPGPRVGQSSFPWILAIPLAYVGISFVLAVVKTIRKFTSPKEVRRELVSLVFTSSLFAVWICALLF